MTMTKDTILETTLGKRGDGDTFTLQATWGDLPANAQERIIRYGFQRIFNDRVGGSDKTLDDKVKAAKEMLEAFKRGEVHAVRTSSGDPVLDETRRLALAAWKLANGDKAESDKRIARVKAMDDDERDAHADAILHKAGDKVVAALTEKAKAEIARKAKEREEKRKARESVGAMLGNVNI